MAQKHLQQLFQNIVDDQLSAGKPACVPATFDRLLGEGYSEQEAKTMMAGVIAYHMSNVIDHDQPFNNGEYQRLLEQLPKFPTPQ